MTYAERHPSYAHQRACRAKAKLRPAFGIFAEMGCGKSKIVLDELGEAYNAGTITRALVVAGKGSYADWINEHLPTHCAVPYVAHLWRGGSAKEQRELNTWLATPDAAQGALRVLVVNVEACGSSLKAQQLVEHFVRNGRCAIVVDESSKIKNPTALRTKFLCKVGRRSPLKRIMTGSPVTKNPLDLYGQFQFLGEGLLGYRNFNAFRARYVLLNKIVVNNRLVDVVATPCIPLNIDELESRVAQHSYRILKKDCLDLPPKVYERVTVELTNEQERMLEELKRWATTQLETGEYVSGSNAVSLMLRAHQIICGHTVDESGVVHAVPNNRLAALENALEETSGKVIIWCAYRHDVDTVLAMLGRVYGRGAAVRYDGTVPAAQRDVAKERFQHGDARFFVGTLSTGAYGLTLTASNTTFYYSNSYDLELRLQSEDRNHRIGQGSSVTYVDLVCPGTIDDKILQALRNKQNIAERIMGDDPRNWLVWP